MMWTGGLLCGAHQNGPLLGDGAAQHSVGCCSHKEENPQYTPCYGLMQPVTLKPELVNLQSLNRAADCAAEAAAGGIARGGSSAAAHPEGVGGRRRWRRWGSSGQQRRCGGRRHECGFRGTGGEGCCAGGGQRSARARPGGLLIKTQGSAVCPCSLDWPMLRFSEDIGTRFPNQRCPNGGVQGAGFCCEPSNPEMRYT